MQSNFFPPYLRLAAKMYVSTSYSVVRQETIEISEQRTAFVWFFAQEVDWCMKDCDKQRLQTTVSINLWKILAGHTGDWFDVKTASICTTELWDALKSFILTSLKLKVAPCPIIVSLDTLTYPKWPKTVPKHPFSHNVYSMTVSKMSDFFVSTAWSCVYLQRVATEIQSSKVNLPKYFDTYKKQVFFNAPWLCFITTNRWKGIKKICGNVF